MRGAEPSNRRARRQAVVAEQRRFAVGQALKRAHTDKPGKTNKSVVEPVAQGHVFGNDRAAGVNGYESIDVFEQLETVTALPRFFEGATKAAAIRLSPDERFLFASNRGFDSIAVFRLDGKGGLSPHDLVLSGGVSPRDINFLPGGKMFAAANEETDNVVFYDYDAEAGKLTPNGLEFRMTHPLYIFW